MTSDPWISEPAEDQLSNALDSSRSWQPVDLSMVLDGSYEPPLPIVGKRMDQVGLFYPGRTHTVVSESEAGKTWFALSACADEMNTGNHVLYVDFEDDEGGIVGRLLYLGIDREVIRERFHYLRPADAIGTGIHLDDLHAVLSDFVPTLGVIDGITEAMALHGLDPNKNDEVATFGKMLPRRIARSGAAAVSLDHVTKDREGRGRWAIGAQHKLSGLDGASYTLSNRSSLGIGLRGVSTIKIAKDRPGQLRRHGLPSGGLYWFGDLVLDSHGEDFADVWIESPAAGHSDEDWRPTALMGKVAGQIAERGPLSQRKIITAVGGKRQYVIDAVNYLILDGYLSEESPHRLLQPYPVGGDSQ